MAPCAACAGKGGEGSERGWHECGVFVGCDDDCRALENPETAEEKDATLEHFKNHMYLSGCSHGC